MGIQVAIRGRERDSETGEMELVKLHGPTRPKGRGWMLDPYFGFPQHAQPWRGSVAEGYRALARWLESKPALARRAETFTIYAVREPDDVRGKRAQERAQEFKREAP